MDGWDASKDKVKQWKDKGKIVIGYISAGSLENWRPDKNDFSDRVVGDSMDGWDGEKWFYLKYWEDLKKPMEERLKMLKDKGFDGYEGDNIMMDNSQNKGYLDENKNYGKWLADKAHSLGLLAIMKNGSDNNFAKDMEPHYDAIIVEEAFKYNEVDAFEAFRGKAVWFFEYKSKDDIEDDIKDNKYDVKKWATQISYDTKNGWEDLWELK